MKVLTIFFTMVALNSFAADSKLGAKLYKKINCAQCHDKDGLGKAKMVDGKYKLAATKGPRVAGLDEKYAYEQLKAIQTKKRKTRYTTTMYIKIKKLSDDDLKNLAAHLAKDLNAKAGAHKGMNQ